MKKLSSILLLICATASFALQGGPTQPDYIEFEPSDMKDMVGLLTGNFAYSIPLGSVPGPYGSYPLSLSYHAGISPQKEATWVGLGWTLSPGSIVRDLRGVPDDQFHGGTLGFIYEYMALYTWNVNLSFSSGVFSVGVSASSIGGGGLSVTMGPEFLDKAGVKVVGGLGFKISTNPNEGLGLEGFYHDMHANVGFSPRNGWSVGGGFKSGNDDFKASIGVQYISGGDLAFNVGMSARNEMGGTRNLLGASIRKNGASASIGPVNISIANSPVEGKQKSSTVGFGLVVPTCVGWFSLGFNQTLLQYRMKATTSDYVYGYMYQGGPAILVDGDNNIDEIPNAQIGLQIGSRGYWTFKGRTMETLGNEKMQPAYDMFTVESEGVSGTFRAFPREEHQMFNLISNRKTRKKENVESYNPILTLDEDTMWPNEEDFDYMDKKDLNNSQRKPSVYKYYKATSTLKAPFADYKTNYINEGNRMVYRANKESDKPLTSGINFLFLGEGGYYESEIFGSTKEYGTGKVTSSLLKRSIRDDKNSIQTTEYPLYGSRKVEPILEDENNPVSKIKGFVITSSNGAKYFFTQPVKTYLKVDYTINQEKGTPVFIDKKNSTGKGFWSNFFTEGLWSLVWPPKLLENIRQAVMGKLDEKCSNGPSDEKMLYSYQVNMNPYATQWLLTEIQGPDYVQLDKNDISKNVGYNVKFYYTKPSLYQWRSPFAQPNAASSDLPNFRMQSNGMTPEGCDTKMYQAAFGLKENVYLERIETATHEVKFELNNPETEERVDGKGWYFDRRDKNQKKTLPIFTIAAISLNVKSVNEDFTEDVYYYDITKNNEQIIYRLHNEEDDEQPLKNWHEAKYEFDVLYVNVEIPELLQADLRKNPNLTIESDYFRKIIYVGDGNSILLKSYDFKFEVDNTSKNMIEKTTGDETKYGLYKIKLKKGDGVDFFWHSNPDEQDLFNEAVKGHVKLVFGENAQSMVVGNKKQTYDLNQCTLSQKYNSNTQMTYDIACDSENSEEKWTPPLLDWSDIVFSEKKDDASLNQMRYLKKISYYNKKSSDPYREYTFEYDYSLHPKTLNSYCKSRYPIFPSDIQNSPLQANLDICSTDKVNRYLYGKLTLKSITEKGCQNGRCSSLPPFKFDYNVASQTSTRYSVANAWMEWSMRNTPQKQKYTININSSSSGSSSSESSSSGLSSSSRMFFSEDYYGTFTDIDASVVATINSIDEWGFWNIYGNENNHKVNVGFADYGAAAWSLNKITDPAGGVMEIKYERDEYRKGEDHSNEHLFVPIFRIEKCSNIVDRYGFISNEPIDALYNDKTCALFLPMYWHEECLGPYTAFWNYERPKNYQGGMYDYMDSLGIVKNDQINERQSVYFKLHTELSTTVDCGVLDLFDCDRYRKVGVLGSTRIKAKYDGIAKKNIWSGDLPYELQKNNYTGRVAHGIENYPTNFRLLVFDKDFGMVNAGIQKAADNVSEKVFWEYIYVEGDMWAERLYTSMKGGDIRVKSLVRYDIDRTAKTEYVYETGELAQLPDSAYTTVMGNGYNVDSWTYALPDLSLHPKSRIVGFEDDDLLYIPGATVMYPKVTIKNSGNKKTDSENNENIANGKTEFEYITPEKGIPEEYIDPETRDKVLRPFIHVNVNFMTWGGDDKKHDMDDDGGNYRKANYKDYLARPVVMTFAFYRCNQQMIGNPMNIMLRQDKTTSFNFYDDDVKSACYIGFTYQHDEGIDDLGTIGFKDPLTNFNEIMLTIARVPGTWHISPNWFRTQDEGYYPIMYKEIFYTHEKEIVLEEVKEQKDIIKKQTIIPDLEEKIVYHDFTAFLGMNTKVSYYRGNDENAILLKVDSSVYSTKVPDVLSGLAEGSNVVGKLGKQVERWKNNFELQCVDDNGDCRRSQRSLSSLNSEKITIDDKEITHYKNEVSFEFKRYPIFQIKSITTNGFDNQEREFDIISSSSHLSSSSSVKSSSSSCDDRCKRNKNRRQITITENHKYDPVTSNPTATLARIPAKDGGEIRKLTVKLPHHAVMEDESGNFTELAEYAFKKNMLSQNYADFVYFDSEPVNSSTSWNNLEKVEYLKSFSMSLLNRYKGKLIYSNGSLVEDSKYPYIEWGAFTTKSDPVEILKNKNPYIFVAGYHDVEMTGSSAKWPNKRDFSGNHILQVDKYFRPVEVEDELKRLLSAHYSDDGLHQTGLFFPSALNKTASIVPYGDEISEVNIKTSLKNNLKIDLNKGGMIVQSSVTLSRSIVEDDHDLIVEYRYKKYGETWQTKRESVNELNLSLSSGDVLNYLRIYPENAEAKTFIYDRYGNIIQIVAEDNTSTFYEYNPLGQLIQTRNDDGVSFKSHHREFTNDDRNEIKWENSVMSSSSKGN